MGGGKLGGPRGGIPNIGGNPGGGPEKLGGITGGRYAVTGRT